uniref:Uncharacterized protein n=1 Tax=Rhizophora mucronata TaxID=61149 RepID=A0A2P2QRV5_RHIMU
MFDIIVVWFCVCCCGGVKVAGFELVAVNVVIGCCCGCRGGVDDDDDDGSIGFGEARGFWDETELSAIECKF